MSENKKVKLKIDGKEIEVEITQEQFEKLCPKNKTGYERVEKTVVYYYNSGTGIACRAIDSYSGIDDKYYKTANYYSDETIAENNARADKLMRQLRRFAVEHREKEFDWGNEATAKLYIFYNNIRNELEIDCNTSFQSFGAIYFDTEETAQLAIDTFKDELLWYFTEYKDSL